MAQNRRWGTTGPGVTTYNYAVDAADGGTIGMQAGSVFKAFTLAAAFEKGISPREYINSPQRKTFAPGDWGCGENFNQPKYTVNNSTGAGTFNMWSGAAMSINTFFVELERQAGLCRTVDIAERMGVKLGNGKPLLRYPHSPWGRWRSRRCLSQAPTPPSPTTASTASHTPLPASRTWTERRCTPTRVTAAAQ